MCLCLNFSVFENFNNSNNSKRKGHIRSSRILNGESNRVSDFKNFVDKKQKEHMHGPFACPARPFPSGPLLKTSGPRISRNSYRYIGRSTAIDVNSYHVSKSDILFFNNFNFQKSYSTFSGRTYRIFLCIFVRTVDVRPQKVE